MPIDIPNTGRDQLCDFYREAGFKVGAEIGVERGNYSEVICRAVPGLHLYCVDAWRAYGGYREHVSQTKLDGFFASTQERLKDHHVTFLRDWSVEAAKQVPDGSLDFVYIDGNHTLPFVIADLAAWTPKVRKGGIIAGHDFSRRTNMQGTQRYDVHVVEAVTTWTAVYGISPWFLLGRKDVVEGEVRDRPRSFFWIKP